MDLAVSENAEITTRGYQPMNRLQQAESLLAILTREEKVHLLQWLVCDLSQVFPGIESTHGVCGGEPCIVDTRIPVWVLEQARQLGMSDAELLRCYPTLRAEDLANAWTYIRFHHAEIEQQIGENEENMELGLTQNF